MDLTFNAYTAFIGAAMVCYGLHGRDGQPVFGSAAMDSAQAASTIR